MMSLHLSTTVKSPKPDLFIKPFSIKSRQHEAIRRMLSLQTEDRQESSKQTVWKVLIYDLYCRNIIMPLFHVKELRKEGVTLHMMLDSEREQLVNVPAIYFVLPIEENINRICQDIRDNLYGEYYLNFACSVPRWLLERFAKKCVDYDAVSQVRRVCDQYVAFVSLEDKLFQLCETNSYVSFHDATMDEEGVMRLIENVVEKLFNVLVSMKVLPIIRCPKGDSAELVAKKLDKKLREQLVQLEDALDIYSWDRPVLLLLDRNIDLSVMVSHGWSYQALIHDLLDYDMNRVKIEVELESEETKLAKVQGSAESKDRYWWQKLNKLSKKDLKGSKSVTKNYYLDSCESWWSEHAMLPFPTVATDIQVELNELNQVIRKHEAAQSPSEARSGSAHERTTDTAESHEDLQLFDTKKMSQFVAAIPEIEDQVRNLSMHMEIATCLMEKIKERHLDQFVRLEGIIMTKPALQHKSDIFQLVQEKKGTLEDILRLFLIYFMSKRHDLKIQELDELEHVLTQLNIDLSPLLYLKKINAFNESWSISAQKTPNTPAKGLKEDLLKTFEDMFSSGVQYIFPSNKDFHVTRILDSVMNIKESHGVNKFLYFDPKFPVDSSLRKNAPFKQAIVFMIGGGSYLELHNIMEYVKRTQTSSDIVSKQVIYGSTEMISPTNFLKQMTILANK